MTRGFVALSLVAALGAAACGGNDEKPRQADPGACRPIVPLVDYPDPWGGSVDCNALDGYEVMLLDDFEPYFTELAWYVNNDRTADQDPPVHTNAPPHMSVIPGGRCVGVAPFADALCDISEPDAPPGSCENDLPVEAHGAMHIRTGLLTNNGGQLGQTLARCPVPSASDRCDYREGGREVGACSLQDNPIHPQKGCKGFDASAWEGIVLWARIGPGSQASVKVRTADAATDDKGCICNPYTNQNDSSGGCDKWGKFITLDQTFRAYLVRFDELQQGGWGTPSPSLDTSDLFSIAVEYGRGAWDLWLDDIGFYRRKP